MKRNKRIIGITGDIGSGKSTVSNYLTSKGYYVIDADLIAREVAELKRIKQKISDAFDGVIIDGVLDRKKLANIVFRDEEKLRILNTIMHPEIVDRIIKDASDSEEEYVFIDAALLFETGLDKYCDYVILIDVSLETRLDRIIKRDNITKALAYKKISSFSDSKEKKSKSIVINNNGTIDELYKKINHVIKQLTK